MEILNNIWMALSTPNVIIMNIIYLVGGTLENFLTMHLFLSIFNISSTKKQKTIYVIFITIVSIFNIYIIPSPINFIINYIIMVLLIHYIFKLSILKSIFAMVSSAIIFGIIGFLFANPYLTLLNITAEQMNSIPFYRIGYLTIMYVFIYLTTLAIKHKKISLVILENIDFKTKVVILINIVLGLVTLIIHSIILFYYIDILPIFLTFLSFISLLTYFGISIFSLTRVMKLTLTNQRLESAESYNNTLRILHDNVRGFKHDFDNIVTTIGGYIKTEDMGGLKVLFAIRR